MSKPVSYPVVKEILDYVAKMTYISSALVLISRIIWLGDLNYRIALSYRSAKALVEMRNWKALLEKDQVARQ